MSKQSGKIDFSQARFKHLNWKFRIRNFLDGKETLTHEQAVDHTQCDLGKWFYESGKAKYGHLKTVQKFEQEHIVLHRLIKDIKHFKDADDNVKANGLYKEMLIVSDNIVALLTEAEDEINSLVQ